MVSFIDPKPICLVSAALPDEMSAKLGENFHVIPLPPDETLAPPVQSHPDMICSVIGSRIIFPTDYTAKNQEVIDMIVRLSGYSLVLSDAPRGEKYPADVGLNAAVAENFIVCRRSSTAGDVISAAENCGKLLVDVRQGYAGCSCIVAGDAVLTSDRSIFAALSEIGKDVTFADNSGIVLRGYDVGFIGGCGGHFGGVLYFFGNPDHHACAAALNDFAQKHGLKIVRLGDDKMTDHGGMKFLPKIY